MASIMTNPAAMTALQTLQQTNRSLEETQNRISTGYRVAEASDNAAYWSIATTMRSDNKALSTVQDALGLGAATVDVAYTATSSIKDYLDEIKSKLVAATQAGVDKAKIQSEIEQYQEQIEGMASSATFSGSNWLSVDSSDSEYTGFEKVVSSFSRDSDGVLSISTIEIDLAETAMFDANPDASGLLDQGQALVEDGDLQDVAEVAGTGGGAPAVVAPFADMSAGVALDGDDAIQFHLVYNGETTTVTIDKSTVSDAGVSDDGDVADAAEMATVVEHALGEAGFDTTNDLTVAANGNAVEITHGTDDTDQTLEIANSATTGNGNFFSVMGIDITNATKTELDSYINGIDRMAETVTTAASDLGAYQKRIDLQSDFVSNLMDAIDRGVGQLVDANMDQESTRLQALQTQQQLGIQSLSIANQNAQSILALFQG